MKKIFFLLLLAFTSGCASTHGTFITEKQDAWIDGYNLKNGAADRGLLFCRANIKEDGLADPICFETRFEEFEDEKEKVAENKKSKR